jgi:hypothetical protein
VISLHQRQIGADGNSTHDARGYPTESTEFSEVSRSSQGS